MEQDIGILIADLSGYTSLTDAHGASAAADLIDKYMGIVQKALIGGSELHQRTGDEVLIISESADDLLCTAISLIQNTSTENEFLQIHGGLHFGKVLKRHDHYFGNTINLTSRIARKAPPGAVWCSEDFLKALANVGSTTFEPMGEHDFKNLRDKVIVSELRIARAGSLYIDPVCKMQIRDKANAVPHPIHTGIYFCSQTCLNIYLAQ